MLKDFQAGRIECVREPDINATSLKGKIITIQFTGSIDATVQTSLKVDDTALTIP